MSESQWRDIITVPYYFGEHSGVDDVFVVQGDGDATRVWASPYDPENNLTYGFRWIDRDDIKRSLADELDSLVTL